MLPLSAVGPFYLEPPVTIALKLTLGCIEQLVSFNGIVQLSPLTVSQCRTGFSD